METAMNISGIVIKTLPKHTQGVIKKLKKIPNADYHFHDELGRIIATIEAEDVSAEIAILSKIEKIEHVISAEMSYAYAEEELNKERDALLSSKNAVPAVLQDEDAKAEDIQYSGSVEKYLKK
jgi:nitrate reductase NapD